MIKSKNKKCIECGREDQPHFSKGKCKGCASKTYAGLKKTPLKKTAKTITKQTVKTKEKRKANREGFGDFFIKHIQTIQEGNLSCQECGKRITSPNASNVAHILGKSKHLEVATNDLNVLYLCGMFSDNQCHSKFDSSMSNRESMNVFSLAFERYKLIKHLVIKGSSETRLFDKYLEDE